MLKLVVKIASGLKMSCLTDILIKEMYRETSITCFCANFLKRKKKEITRFFTEIPS